MIKHNYKVKEKWSFRARNWLGSSKYGLMVMEIRRGRGEWISPKLAPDYVKSFLQFPKDPENPGSRACIEGIHSLDELLTLDEVKPGRRKRNLEAITHVTIEHNVDRKPSAVTRDLRRVARKSLKRRAALMV